MKLSWLLGKTLVGEPHVSPTLFMPKAPPPRGEWEKFALLKDGEEVQIFSRFLKKRMTGLTAFLLLMLPCLTLDSEYV